MNPSEVEVVCFYENYVFIILFLNFNCFTPIIYAQTVSIKKKYRL